MDGSPPLSALFIFSPNCNEKVDKDIRNMSDLIKEDLSSQGSHVHMVLQAAEVFFECGAFVVNASVDVLSSEINAVLLVAKGEEQIEYINEKTVETCH